MFKEGRENVHGEPTSGRPSLVNADLIEKVDTPIREDRRFTLSSFSGYFSEVSRSLLHEIVTER